tara:strand:+ start:554 stop:799 length:246 start_codon:yes stop_codon:yes gene_type:complete
MNKNIKNTVITIVLVGLIGIIFFKVLFAFILPIILFVVLMSILKVLIKGFDEDQDTVNSELLDNNLNGNSVKSIVTITLED